MFVLCFKFVGPSYFFFKLHLFTGSTRSQKDKKKKRQKDASVVVLDDSVLSNCVKRENFKKVSSSFEGKI